MNQFTGLGMVVDDPEIKVSTARRNYAYVLLSVTRATGQLSDYIPLKVFANDRVPDRHQQFADSVRRGSGLFVQGRVVSRQKTLTHGENVITSEVWVDRWRSCVADAKSDMVSQFIGLGNMVDDAARQESFNAQRRPYGTGTLMISRDKGTGAEAILLRVFHSEKDPNRVDQFVRLSKKGTLLFVVGRPSSRAIETADGEPAIEIHMIVDRWQAFAARAASVTAANVRDFTAPDHTMPTVTGVRMTDGTGLPFF